MAAIDHERFRHRRRERSDGRSSESPVSRERETANRATEGKLRAVAAIPLREGMRDGVVNDDTMAAMITRSVERRRIQYLFLFLCIQIPVNEQKSEAGSARILLRGDSWRERCREMVNYIAFLQLSTYAYLRSHSIQT